MKFKRYTGISWSTVELAGLLEDQDSLVTFERTRKHFGLHPFHLSNLHAAVNEILSAKLNCYDNELKGFILAYKNPKLVGPLGEILYDTCFIHVDVEVDFYVFRPTVGCSLKGIVNKKGPDHVGVLVHKAFNVSIPNRGKRTGMVAEEEEEGEEEDDWPGHKVSIGQEIRFAVIDIDLNSRIPFIRGTLDKRDYLSGCALVLNGECPPELTTDLLNAEDKNETANGPVSRTKKNKKTGREKKFFSSDSENNCDENEEIENGGVVHSDEILELKSPISKEALSSKKSTKEHSKKSKKREQPIKVERESSEERRIRKDRKSERRSREKLVKVEERMEEEDADEESETAELQRSESVERKPGKRKAEKIKGKWKLEGSVTGLEEETLVKSERVVGSSDSEVSTEDRKKPSGRKKKDPREWSETIQEEVETRARAPKREERRVKIETSYVDERESAREPGSETSKRELSVKKIKVERAGSILDNDQEEGDPVEAANTTSMSESKDQDLSKDKKKKKKKRRKEEEAGEEQGKGEEVKIKSEPEEWWYNVRVKKEIMDTQSEEEASDRGKHREGLVKDSGSGEELRLENVKIKAEKNWER